MKSTVAVSAEDELLVRVRSVAHRITNRVRLTLNPVAAHAPIRRSLRVLCVDDVADAADALAAILETLGCETRVCYSGLAALDIVSEFHPDACFLDLCMPGMSGLELAARLRSEVGGRALFLIAVTALGSLEDQTRTAVTGFHYHLVKPVDGATLTDLIDQLTGLLHHTQE